MGSLARRAFNQNRKDIHALLEFHREKVGDDRGRREARLEVLNKSAIVLMTACWEAYCEDIAAEAIEHLVVNLSDPVKLPKELRKRVVKSINEEVHELAMWNLANDGWKNYLKARLDKLRQERNWSFMSPKSEKVRDLFADALGIEDITSAWSWENMDCGNAAKKLDGLVELRGAVAHRVGATRVITKAQVTSYLTHVEHLVKKTGGRINTIMKQTTGVPLWEKEDE